MKIALFQMKMESDAIENLKKYLSALQNAARHGADLILYKAEQLLLDLGFQQVRVRIHGNIARIELMPQEFEKLMQEDVRKTVYAEFKSLGFSYVTLDLMGYRTGSMNETLDEQK